MLEDEDFGSMFGALCQNSGIQALDLSHLYNQGPTLSRQLLLPLLASCTLKKFVFPERMCLDSTVLGALKVNSSIREVTFNMVQFDATAISEVLKVNKSLKKLEILRCSGSYVSIFESLVSNDSLLELIIDNSPGSSFYEFTYREVEALKKMLQQNTTLLVLTLDGALISSIDLEFVLKGLEKNSVLKQVRFPGLNVSCLILLFKALSANKLKMTFTVSPHFIDIETGVFRFSPVISTGITDEDLVSLHYLSSSVKEFSLKGCTFSDEAYTCLLSFIRNSTSLTSVDFSGSVLSDDQTSSFSSVLNSLSISNFTK
ncbi:hypothetical protein GEMRC1_011999 [Eukaryota sp. GEM-RC1]